LMTWVASQTLFRWLLKIAITLNYKFLLLGN
jgi:hypothetical protein